MKSYKLTWCVISKPECEIRLGSTMNSGFYMNKEGCLTLQHLVVFQMLIPKVNAGYNQA
ncbi:Hypothetical protein PP7435_CHR1-2401 [Komagataella phaffii CBS 7435]|uniref:Uncharacterized protein n=1 Tax=Komagataella phaffii (strain ATCC 76273 / CBS 7435 / CECT 11047 / NRRL Y-11430 / Wegner 21-1) TaxID=981350 RepID=A0A1G4KPC0_KOMPC|nr:Hypothetical protein BQ9382_C1-3751 [Komagataella phaffii CBS 7435]SCV11843.1 Hypothetical protein PP7435_CHR1-2401 [Komagataella phaffii CBS 7435]